MNSVEELYEQRMIVAPYCVSKRISPYEFLILDLLSGGKTITDIQVAFGLSKLVREDQLLWFTKTNKDQPYKINALQYMIRYKLYRKNLITIEGEESDLKLRTLELTDTGKNIVEGYKQFRRQAKVMQEEKLEKEKDLLKMSKFSSTN